MPTEALKSRDGAINKDLKHSHILLMRSQSHRNMRKLTVSANGENTCVTVQQFCFRNILNRNVYISSPKT